VSWTAANPVQRMSLEDIAPRAYASLARFSDCAREALPEALAALIDIRVSQLNGCAYCLEMHYPQARAAGVDERRLDTLPAWRDSPLFSPAEQAALGLAEAVTELGPDGVPEPVWAQAAATFDDDVVAGIVLTAIAMNAWNRVAITTHMAAQLAPA
jgi:AhpD family alkylhydroperoxidase